MRKMEMNLRDIELPYLFQNSTPSKSKVAERKRYFKRMGEFPKIVVRGDNHRLLDGYASYVAAKELGEKKVEVKVLSPKESINYFSNVNAKKGSSVKKERIK